MTINCYRRRFLTPSERFWSRVNKTETCWEWTGGFMVGGYGQFWLKSQNRSIGAHRFAWEEANGPLPAGLFVCHRCDNRKCVRPAHLFAGTPLDNTRDMLAKGRQKKPLGLTHCKHGHEYTPENTYEYKSGRRCRTCELARCKRKYAFR